MVLSAGLSQREALSLLHEHMMRGEAERAAALARQLLRRMPTEAQLHYALGASLLGMGQTVDARKSLKRALELNPKDPGFHHDLALTYKREGRLGEAHRALDKALRLKPQDPTLLSAKAGLFAMAGEHERACAALEPALENEPAHISIALGFGRICGRVGRREEGAALLERCLLSPDLPHIGRVDALFTLGTLYDQMGRHDEAFERFARANALKGAAFDPAAFASSVGRMLDAWTPEAVGGLARAGVTATRALFIVGMPRSATTLVEQILGSHPRVFAGGELSEVDRFVFETMGGRAPGGVSLLTEPGRLTRPVVDRAAKGYLEKLRRLGPSAQRVTDKMPINFLHLGAIWALLPGARVIHCVRDPLDTCLSCYFHHFSGANSFAYDLGHLGAFYRQYERIVGHWRGVLDTPVLDVRYEELVADQEGMSRRIVEFVGLEWNDACLRFHENKRVALTASNDQVRRKMYGSSVGRYKAYEKHLGPLRSALEDGGAA